MTQSSPLPDLDTKKHPSTQDMNELPFYLNEVISVRRLSVLFGTSASELYNDLNLGRFGRLDFKTATVAELIRTFRSQMVKMSSSSVNQPSSEGSFSFGTDGYENKAMMLQEKTLEQKIRLDRAREIELWLKIAESRKQLLIKENLLTLYRPLFVMIKNGLISIAADTEDAEVKIAVDKLLREWYNIGQQMLETSATELNTFVDTMVELPIESSIDGLQFTPPE